MKSLLLFILVLYAFPLFANDGVYLTRGSIIYPVYESDISLEKEMLSFKVRDENCQVDIHFEFYNPSNTEEKLLIGFQAPTAMGDVSDSISNLNQIADFRIVNDDRLIPYHVKAAECADCDLKDPSEFHFSQFDSGILVFLFEITFKPGINTIHHSYSFPATMNVSFDQIYNYILTTGAKWAGGTIKELTIQIDMGPNQYFYVKDIFGEKADWSVTGAGKVTNKRFYHIDDTYCNMVRILSGFLQISVRDFNPLLDIEFGIVDSNAFVDVIPNKGITIGIRDLYLDPDKEYTQEQLRLMRNMVYAQYGYAFNNKEMADYFSQFAWYMPDPNLKLEQIVLNAKEQAFVDAILKREKK